MHFADLHAAHDRWGLADQGPLDATHRALLTVAYLRQEVNADGFEGYFRYSGGDTAPDALSLLPLALGQAWADLLAEAMALFGTTYPVNVDEREAVLEIPGVEAALDDLDRLFYALEAESDADALLNAYMQVHAPDWPDPHQPEGPSR